LRGTSCNLIACPFDCAGNGQCSDKGKCVCNRLWSGEYCNVQQPDYPLIAIIVVICVLATLLLAFGALLIVRHVLIQKYTKKLEAQQELNNQDYDENDISSSSDD